MKKIVLSLLAVISWTACASAATIAHWTFETSVPTGTPGAGVWITNLSAEIGTGTASGLHAGNSIYSNPAGNGTLESFSSTLWAAGDFYQFALGTIGYTSISLSYDQTSSGTGPGNFYLSYSTDGVNFNVAGGTNLLLVNGPPNFPWSTTIATNGYNFAYDLSSITALADATLVYFRVVDANTLTPSGGTVAVGGTSRVDNFIVNGTVIPEPTSFALAALGGFSVLGYSLMRRRNK